MAGPLPNQSDMAALGLLHNLVFSIGRAIEDIVIEKQEAKLIRKVLALNLIGRP